MHQAVLDYVKRWATDEPIEVLDIGGRDVNGSPRHMFPAAFYHSIDKVDGPGVGQVADAVTWRPHGVRYDLVLCLEVFEHEPQWPAILWTARLACKKGGRLVVTCAGLGRPVHSSIDGNPRLQDGEYYRNIDPMRLVDCLSAAGWYIEECHQVGDDVQATAVKYE